MTIARALDAAAVGAEFGRSADWIYEHWRDLVEQKRLPRPVSERGGLAWNAAQVYALLDRELTPKQRATAAAYRAALHAAQTSSDHDAADIADARAALNARFART